MIDCSFLLVGFASHPGLTFYGNNLHLAALEAFLVFLDDIFWPWMVRVLELFERVDGWSVG
jgi:hypothetical protein